MNLSNIEIGKVYKNYKVLCEVLDEPIKTGNAKIAQLKEWNRHMKLIKIGYKYKVENIIVGNKSVITEEEFINLYGTEKQKEKYENDKKSIIQMRKQMLKEASRHCDIYYNKCNKKYIINGYYKNYIPKNKQEELIIKFMSMDGEESKLKGVYKIEDENKNIYIGSTIKSFYERFKGHYVYPNKKMLHTKELIDNGGKMYALWVAPDGTSEQEIRAKEREYILKYLNDSEYNVINHRDRLPDSDIIKIKKKTIKVSKDDYDKAIELLNNHKIKIYNKQGDIKYE